MTKELTFGVIVGNRGFFPRPSRQRRPRGDASACSKRPAYEVIVLTPEQTQVRRRARRPTKRATAPSSSSKHRDEIDGIIVTLPNFGDERAIADTIRLATLDVPVLVQATPDRTETMKISRPPRQLLRQDVGLQQPQAVRHSLLAHHAAHRRARVPKPSRRTSPGSPPSAASSTASAICASAPSARAPPPSTPSATARSCSKRAGISVETLDLSEIFGRIDR